MDTNTKNAVLLLKCGLSFTFLYSALSAFMEPSMWLGYIPSFINNFISRELFLTIFSTFEIILALCILFWNSIFPSIIAGFMIISIVILNKNEFFVVFRDISIASMAFALAFLVRNNV